MDMLDGNSVAEFLHDTRRSGPEALKYEQWRREQKLAAFIEKYLDEAIGECLMDSDEILSDLKHAMYEDNEKKWDKACNDLFYKVRQYVHEYA